MPNANAPNGFFLVDKPLGPTSAAVTNRLKWLINRHLNATLQPGEKKKKVKIGHGGTLDPLATGVLPIGVGKATKQLQALLEGPKTYRFTLTFGTATTTDDAEGSPTATSDVRPTDAQIRAILPIFTGEVTQLPPPFSALKVNGQRAYALARAGQEVTLQPRTITIHRLIYDPRPPTLDPHVPEATFTAEVSKGTYIRALARDMAVALGTVGHVTLLQRTQHGPFRLSDCISLETLDQSLQTGHITAHLRPLDACLAGES